MSRASLEVVALALSILLGGCGRQAESQAGTADPEVISIVCVLGPPQTCNADSVEAAIRTALTAGSDNVHVEVWLSDYDRPPRKAAQSSHFSTPRKGGPVAQGRAKTLWAAEQARLMARSLSVSLGKQPVGPQHLVEALAAVSLTSPSTIIVLSSGLEVSSYADMACRRKRPRPFATAVSARGLPSGSMQGTRVHFLEFRPGPLRRRGCSASTNLWRAAQSDWRAALEGAGATAHFHAGNLPASAIAESTAKDKE